MRNDARTAILICTALGALGGSGSGSRAQQMPTPTPVACARPYVPATVVHPAPIATPPLAAQQGIEGTVQVIVSLDVNSRVVGAKIRSSPSAVLNPAAIAAARETTFQTEIRDCRPIAADYIYTVDFDLGARFTTTDTGEHIVTVTGRGTVKRAPDRAHVMAMIVTHDETEAGATAKNDAAFSALKAKLAPLGIGEGDVRGTSSVRSLLPPGAPFASTRPVDIAVGRVSNAVHVAAAAAAQASVTVNGIRYELTDRTAAARDALSLAVKDAENRARGAATMQRLQLGVLKQVSAPLPSSTTPYPAVVVGFQPAAGGFTKPDITVPEIPVSATATASYAVMP